jgi:uncharacterized protein YraI
MFKLLIFLTLVCFSGSAYAQQYITQSWQFSNNINSPEFNQSAYYSYTPSYNTTLPPVQFMSDNSSIDPNIQRVHTFFQMRQLNRYYRDLEAIQYEERIRLKRTGQFTIENLNSLYGFPNY